MMAEEKPKLLIVEDDAGLQAQLKWSYPDFEVIIAGDRASAIAALRAEEPAVVTLDLGLPPDPDGTTEGFAVLDEIMAIKPDTKVIVATGHGARESALQSIARGAYDFYQKPVDIDAIGLITGQVGYAWNNVLFYVKGGAMGVSDKYQGYVTATNVVFDRASETRYGGAVGAGLDFGITPNIVLGVDYMHGFLGSRDITFTSVTTGAFSRTDRIRQDVDMVTARLSYKFGGPVIAKY